MLSSRLTHLYGQREAQSIVRLLLHELFGFTLTDICCGAVNTLSDRQRQLLERCMARLEKGEPVQYVIGHTTFYGRTFAVRSGCLIPRPETEELCQWIVNDERRRTAPTVLDIGTGSGCIAITLKKELPAAHVTAWDISTSAIAIAKDNAQSLEADITVEQQDALRLPTCEAPQWDIIVSNPPYICRKEAVAMEANVLDHEPHEALFVPDAEPLLFYRAIAVYAQQALQCGGALYFEINPIYANELRDMLQGLGFLHATLRNDEQGRQRMIKAMHA